MGISLTTDTTKETASSGRGKDTLFRITIRNQIDQISIADNKANMIISITTIIISLVVAFMGAGFSGPYFNSTQIIVPFTILLFASSISAIFSILAARPRFRRGPPNYKSNSMLFFGNFRHMPISKYIVEMEELITSKESVYRNLIIDMYNFGQILDRKYRMLSISYTAFLIGIILTVISYLVMLIITWN